MPPPIIPKIQESDDTCYPPAKFAKDGTSPYFMGKHKAARKRVEKGNVLTKFGFGCEGIISRTQQDRKKQAVSSHSSMIQVPSVLSGTSTNGSNGLSFDFSDDPKLRRVREVIVSIVDSDRKRENDKELHEAVAAASCKSMEQLCGSKSKKSKWRDKQVIASINDFKTASGDEVIKEMKQVLCEHGNTESSSNLLGNSLCSENIDKSRRFLGNRKIPQMFVAPPVKKTLHTMGVKEENGADVSETGLRTESSLKHFEENIISLIESEIMSVTHEIGWSDVAGLEGAKKALREIVVLPFKRPDMFKGIRAPPKGVLLFGPPGTGKTMIGRCVASQCNATFFNISASSLTSKWVGEGEKLVRALFSVARLKLPSVIFIDEVDSLLSSRSEVEHESSRRIKTEFLVQLDGVATNSDERLLVLAATNRPQELDEAARRRFVKRLYIALPDEEARCTIVKNLLADMKHSLDEKQFNQVAKLTEGYSGADVRQLCAEAAMGPIRDIDNCSSLDIETIETEDLSFYFQFASYHIWAQTLFEFSVYLI